MLLEESVHLVEHLEAERLAQLLLGQPAGAVFLQRQRLQCLALKVGPARAKALGEVVGDADSQVHGGSVPHREGAGKRMIKLIIRYRHSPNRAVHPRPSSIIRAAIPTTAAIRRTLRTELARCGEDRRFDRPARPG